MAKVVCVLYDDPVDGYPKTYPRDGLPHLDRYPDGAIAAHTVGSTSHRDRCWAASPVSSAFSATWKASATSWS
jgi:hypothetical protein